MKKIVLGLCLLLPGLASGLPNEMNQEGLLLTAEGQPFEGAHDIQVRLYTVPIGGIPVFDETHRDVQVIDGYYAIGIGSIAALDPAVFTEPQLFMGISVDGAAELGPRTAVRRVPAAFHAQTAAVAHNVTGDITPNSITIGGNVVIDDAGRWLGDPTNLRGPIGPEGPQGPRGPQGPAGAAGVAGGDADPAVVVPLVVQDLVADPGQLPYLRRDAADSKTGDLTLQGGVLRMSANPHRTALEMGNNNVMGVNALHFADPGVNEGLSWAGSEARVMVSPLNGANADGYLRLINDEGISLESAVRVAGDMAITGDITSVQRVTATVAQVTTGTIENATITSLTGPNGEVNVNGTLRLNSDVQLGNANLVGTLRTGAIEAGGPVTVGGALNVIASITAGGNVESGAAGLVRAGSGGFYVNQTRVFDGNGNLLARPVYQCPAGQLMAGTLANGLPRCVTTSCPGGQVFTGLDNALNPVCVSNGLTALPANACPAGQAVVSINAQGQTACGAIGGAVPAGQTCPVGQVMVGIQANGNISCVPSAGVIYQSCKDVLDAGASVGDGNYFIDPNGGNAGDKIEVYCDMTGGGWTHLGHNREARTRRTGCEPPACHDISVTYTAPMGQITALIDNAGSCRQHLLWECRGSVLRPATDRYGYFYGRGNAKNYWPGGHANCEINDNVWRQDGGNVTIKGDLPVTRLRFGDTGDASEEGFHTLGRLMCQ